MAQPSDKQEFVIDEKPGGSKGLGRRSQLTRWVSSGTLTIVTIVLVVSILGGAQLSFVDTITRMALLLALAQSWNLLFGFGGLFSLGISASVGIGAYSLSTLMVKLAWPWPAAMLGSIVAMILIALVLWIALMRLRVDYFAIATLAATYALQAIVLNLPFFGGGTGLKLPTAALPDPWTLGALAVVIAAIGMGLVIYMSNSRFGLLLQAARDHESAAKTLGINVRRNHLVVYLIGAVLAGLVGTVIAMQDGTASPENGFALSWTIGAMLMVVIGGPRTTIGPVIGVFLVYYLLQKQLQNFAALSIIIEGVLLIIIVRVGPRGIWPLVRPIGPWAWSRAKAVLSRRSSKGTQS